MWLTSITLALVILDIQKELFSCICQFYILTNIAFEQPPATIWTDVNYTKCYYPRN